MLVSRAELKVFCYAYLTCMIAMSFERVARQDAENSFTVRLTTSQVGLCHLQEKATSIVSDKLLIYNYIIIILFYNYFLFNISLPIEQNHAESPSCPYRASSHHSRLKSKINATALQVCL